MKRYISCLLFFFCLMALTPLYAATQTLTTYYPAPQGNYKNINVTTLNVSGDTTLGTAGNTITVNGNTTTNGTATVTGAANLNGGSTVTGGNLSVSNGNGISLCSGGSCGILQVSCSGGNCYAVYGP